MQKIKLTIAGRVYPLNVNKDDESQIRESAKSINSMINHFEKNYAVKDKQDVLAMCALQIAVQSIKDFDSSKKENDTCAATGIIDIYLVFFCTVILKTTGRITHP